tara:strand:+ start:182 stop:745 length:564 start_codon:yes stop_codon:yes gene_type:complete
MDKKLNFVETPLKGSFVIEPLLFEDSRGFFSRLFCIEEFSEMGLNSDIVQINHSGSLKEGTIRGLHFQYPPNSEDKIVKCLRGKIYDVIVDLRRGSPTFLKWFGIELSSQNKKLLYVPKGFAHGFQALEKNSEILYFVTSFFSPENEGTLRYDDPKLGIMWKIKNATLSKKDKSSRFLDDSFGGLEL